MNIISLETDVTINKGGDNGYTISEKIKVNRSGFVQILTTSSRVEEKRNEELFIHPTAVFELFNYFNSFSYEAAPNAYYKNGIWMLCLTFSDGSKRVFSGEVKENQLLNISSDALRKLLNKPYLIAFDNKYKTEKLKTFTITLNEKDDEIEKVIFIDSERKLKLYKKEGKKEVFIELKLDLWEIEKLRAMLCDEFFFDFAPKKDDTQYDISFSFSFLMHSDINIRFPFSYNAFYGPYYAFLNMLKTITKETNRFLIFSSIALYAKKDDYVYLDVTFSSDYKKYCYVTKDLLVKEGDNAYVLSNDNKTRVNIKAVNSGSICDAKYPFFYLKPIHSTDYREDNSYYPLDRDYSINYFFSSFVNYKECDNNGYILINALSELINGEFNVYVPTDTSNMSDYHTSSYLIIEDNNNHILPCYFDDKDNLFSPSTSFSVLPFIDYLYLVLDSPGINLGMITHNKKSLILSKELIRYSLTWMPVSVIVTGKYKVEALKVDVVVLYKKGRKCGFSEINSQKYYYINDYSSPEVAMLMYDEVAKAGYHSIFYAPRRKNDAIYKLAKTWKTINCDKHLDMFFSL